MSSNLKADLTVPAIISGGSFLLCLFYGDINMSHMHPVIPGNSHKPLPALSRALKFFPQMSEAMSPGQVVPTLLDLCTVSLNPTVYTGLPRPILNLDHITSMQARVLKWESVSNACRNANSIVPPSSGSPSSGRRSSAVWFWTP